MDNNRSGQQIGQEYVEKLKVYLDSIEALPARSGKVNATAIAEASGVPRQSLYKNDLCRNLLDEAIVSKGLVGIEARSEGNGDKVKLERRIMTLEQSNAAMVAENYELRRQLKKFRHLEEMMEQGKRVIL